LIWLASFFLLFGPLTNSTIAQHTKATMAIAVIFMFYPVYLDTYFKKFMLIQITKQTVSQD
jgi:hypothetical protein